MKKVEKTLGVSCLAARHAEGQAIPSGDDNKSITFADEKMYGRICRAAKKRYNGNAEDVAHETFLIAKTRGYYDKRMLCEAARRLGLWRQAHEDLTAQATPSAALDYRISAAMRYASPRVAKAIRLVLEGYTFREAAHAVGLTESILSTKLGKLGGRSDGQGNLFIEGVAGGGR